MKKFLLFILVATASAQAWPFHKKPRYTAQEIAQQEQHAQDVRALQEKDRADQWERIKLLREQVLKSSPVMEMIVLREEQIATGTHYSSSYPGSPAPDLNKYEAFLLSKVNEINARDAWWKIKGDIKHAIAEAKTEADLENPAKSIAAVKRQLAKQEASDSWHDQSFKAKKEDTDQLLTELSYTQERLKKKAYEEKVKADKIAQADADYDARKKLSEEERQAIYKTNGVAERNDYLRSLSPEAREREERRIADINNKFRSEHEERTLQRMALINAAYPPSHESPSAIDASHSLSRMASAMEKQAIAAEQAVFDSRLNSRTAPSLPSDTYSSSKVEYSRTILPSGQTISTTTWK